MKRENYPLTPRERDTVLAALRLYQAWEEGDVAITERKTCGMLGAIEDIARNTEADPLDASEINSLCVRMNR